MNQLDNNPFECIHTPWVKSLNNAYLIDLPHISIPDKYKNLSGFKLLSAKSVQDEFNHILSFNATRYNSLLIINHIFDHGNPDEILQVTNLANTYGQKLGYFFVMLIQGDEGNRNARRGDFKWSAEQWCFWSTIRNVALAGGVIAGRFGEIAINEANRLLQSLNINLQLHRFIYYRHISLIGLSRIINSRHNPILLFDFGKTSVEIGCAFYKDNYVNAIQIIANEPSHCDSIKSKNVSKQHLRDFANHIVDIIEKYWHLTLNNTPNLSPVIGLSMGCTIVQGNLSLQFTGIYGKLRKIIQNFPYWLRIELYKRNISICHIYVHNDGDCAAYALNPDEYDAVVTLGTALGLGFTKPKNNGFFNLAETFQLNEYNTNLGE